jgi:hypothetical protein
MDFLIPTEMNRYLCFLTSLPFLLSFFGAQIRCVTMSATRIFIYKRKDIGFSITRMLDGIFALQYTGVTRLEYREMQGYYRSMTFILLGIRAR